MRNRDDYNNRDRNGGGMMGIGVLGAIAGAAASYYLFGTEKGNEQRQKAMQYAKETKDKLVRTGDELTDKIGQVYGDVKSILKDKYTEIADLSSDEKARLSAKLEAHWKDIKSDIEEALAKSDVEEIT